MKLRGEELKRRAEEAQISVEALASAVDRTGLSGGDAVSAVRNWIGGRDQPRCKKADIERLAEAVGCEAKDIARFVSGVRFHRGSDRKAGLVAGLVRGKSYYEASDLLRFNPKRAAVNVRKALDAALAEAQEVGADTDMLYVAEARVDQGPHIKRFQPKDRGRAHPILKRTSHITIGLQERVGAARY